MHTHTYVHTHKHRKGTQMHSGRCRTRHACKHKQMHRGTNHTLLTCSHTLCTLPELSPLPHEWDVDTVCSCNSNKGYPSTNQGRGSLYTQTTNITHHSPPTAVPEAVQVTLCVSKVPISETFHKVPYQHNFHFCSCAYKFDSGNPWVLRLIACIHTYIHTRYSCVWPQAKPLLNCTHAYTIYSSIFTIPLL